MKNAVAVWALKLDLTGYFKCTVDLENKVFTCFWHAFEVSFLFHFLNIIVLLMVTKNPYLIISTTGHRNILSLRPESDKNIHIINTDCPLPLMYVSDRKKDISVRLSENIWVKCIMANQETYFPLSLL